MISVKLYLEIFSLLWVCVNANSWAALRMNQDAYANDNFFDIALDSYASYYIYLEGVVLRRSGLELMIL